MKHNKTIGRSLSITCLALLVAFTIGIMPSLSLASGTANPTTVTITKDTSVTANFR